MARVLADHVDLAMATDDLTLITHLLDRRAYLHDEFLPVIETNAYIDVLAQPQALVFPSRTHFKTTGPCPSPFIPYL